MKREAFNKTIADKSIADEDAKNAKAENDAHKIKDEPNTIDT